MSKRIGHEWLVVRLRGWAPQTLNDRVNTAEVDSGRRPGVSSAMAERMKALERDNRE